MSLLGSLNTAVGGMNAQSAALSSISNNVANSQTVGFKETDTSFIDYLTDPANNSYTGGAVAAFASYTNSQQGTITQVSNPTSLAISGNGFFAVQQQTSSTTFNPLPFYTRAGDFSADSQGYLVNSEGYTLDGWPSQNAAGTEFNSAALVPIKIDKAPTPASAYFEFYAGGKHSVHADWPAPPPPTHRSSRCSMPTATRRT